MEIIAGKKVETRGAISIRAARILILPQKFSEEPAVVVHPLIFKLHIKPHGRKKQLNEPEDIKIQMKTMESGASVPNL